MNACFLIQPNSAPVRRSKKKIVTILHNAKHTLAVHSYQKSRFKSPTNISCLHCRNEILGHVLTYTLSQFFLCPDKDSGYAHALKRRGFTRLNMQSRQ